MAIKMNNEVIEAINLAAKYPSIIRVGIFGSYARGEQTADSDIDILYDYNDLMINDTIKYLSSVQDKIDMDIDFVAYEDLFDINNEYDAEFKNSVLSDLVWIYDRRASY